MKLSNGKTLSVVKAEADDASDIVDFLNCAGGESDHLLFGENEFRVSVADEEAFIAQTNSSRASVLLVGKIDDKIISTGSLIAHPRPRAAHRGEVGICVSREFWGLGVGSCMMQALLDVARASHQIEVVHGGMRHDNSASVNLCKKFGFKHTGINKGFFKIGETYYDEILMSLRL